LDESILGNFLLEAPESTGLILQAGDGKQIGDGFFRFPKVAGLFRVPNDFLLDF